MSPEQAQAIVGSPGALSEILKPGTWSSAGKGVILNNISGEAKKIPDYPDDESQPTSVKEYQFYKSNLPAGQEPMPYDTWATAKARAGALNVNMPGSEKASDAEYGKIEGKMFGDIRTAGSLAGRKLQDLGIMEDAYRRGGDAISGGPLGGSILKAKQLASSFGINLDGTQESEIIQKVNFALSTEAVRRWPMGPTAN